MKSSIECSNVGRARRRAVAVVAGLCFSAVTICPRPAHAVDVTSYEVASMNFGKAAGYSASGDQVAAALARQGG